MTLYVEEIFANEFIKLKTSNKKCIGNQRAILIFQNKFLNVGLINNIHHGILVDHSKLTIHSKKKKKEKEKKEKKTNYMNIFRKMNKSLS